MNYMDFIQALEARMGSLNVPFNANATSLSDLFESPPLHHRLMTQFAKAVYKENRCCHLKAMVTPDQTYQALAPIRLQILQSAKTDIELYGFIDELCYTIEDIFNPQRNAEEPTINVKPGQDDKEGIVIDFDQRRQRRLNSSAS